VARLTILRAPRPSRRPENEARKPVREVAVRFELSGVPGVRLRHANGNAQRLVKDVQAQFLIAVGDLCAAAMIGGLPILLTLEGGGQVAGVPAALRVTQDGDDELDETGFGRTFRVDDAVVNLDDIIECTIRAPVFIAAEQL
jgi:hypothetical protein